jgi:hypothetical protein
MWEEIVALGVPRQGLPLYVRTLLLELEPS